MVEFTLVLPLLVTLLAGIVEVTDALFTYSSVVDATRDGARMGMKTTDDGAVLDAVAADLRTLRDPTPLGNVVITRSGSGNNLSVRVRVCHNHRLLIDYPLVPLPNPISICASTTMRQFSGL